jgi:hypothetical protein
MNPPLTNEKDQVSVAFGACERLPEGIQRAQRGRDGPAMVAAQAKPEEHRPAFRGGFESGRKSIGLSLRQRLKQRRGRLLATQTFPRDGTPPIAAGKQIVTLLANEEQ